MEKKDLVIGFITGYDFDKIKPWVNSLLQTGFSGDKIVVIYNGKKELSDKLQQLGFGVIAFNESTDKKDFTYPTTNFNIVVNRFADLYNLLTHDSINGYDNYRYVITTDMADVVFQSDPSEWMTEKFKPFGKELCVSSEGLKYKDEPWGANNMQLSFGESIYQKMKDLEIYNAGTIAGTPEALSEFALNVYLLCRGAPLFVPGGGGPDQAALNVLLSMYPWKNVTMFNSHNKNWACQCGTTVDPNKIETFRNALQCREPLFENGVVVTNNLIHEKYVLVHQYNRVPEWNEQIRKKYE